MVAAIIISMPAPITYQYQTEQVEQGSLHVLHPHAQIVTTPVFGQVHVYVVPINMAWW